MDIQELDGPQIDLKLKKFFFSQSSFINFYVSLRKGGEDYTLNKVDFQIFPADADHPLGYDPEQNLKKYWSITHTPKIISLNIKKGYFKTLRPHYGIWNAIISLQLGYKSEKIKRTIQTRFAIQSESGVRLVGKSLSFKDKQMQLEIELNAPLKGNYRVGANLLGLKSQELAFCWQEKVLKQGSNKVILPIPKKYLSLNKSLAVKIPKKEDYKIVDIEVFSPALAPKSTYFYFP